MPMPSVTYSREIPLAANTLHKTIAEVLEGMAALSGSDAIVLSALVGNTTAKISIPVELALMRRSTKDSSVGISIKARSAEALFPHFKGEFHSLPMAPARTNLRLKGTYSVPLGPVGATINKAGFNKMAEESLHDLFERVADESVAAVRDDSEARRRDGRA